MSKQECTVCEYNNYRKTKPHCFPFFHNWEYLCITQHQSHRICTKCELVQKYNYWDGYRRVIDKNEIQKILSHGGIK